MRTPDYLSIRTKHPTSNWRLFADVARHAEHALRSIVGGAELKNSWTLLVFLCKTHGHPQALNTPGYWFPICRRALSDRKATCPDHLSKVEELDMSASQIQCGIPKLLKAGFTAIIPRIDGATHHRKNGEVRRVAIQYCITPYFRRLLLACQPVKEKQSTNERYKPIKLAKGNEVTVVDQKPRVGKPNRLPVYENLMKSKHLAARKAKDRTLVTALPAATPLEKAVERIRGSVDEILVPPATFVAQLHQRARTVAPARKASSAPIDASNPDLEAALTRLGRIATGSEGGQLC